jgi:prepilin-type N-terminal cleavage/methylation domain-containing protein
MPRGFTLLEVLIATVVITVGVLALLSAFTTSSALIGQGRRASLAALHLASRLDQLRAEVEAARPDCRAPAPGSRIHGPALQESWSARAAGGVVELVAAFGADTAVSRVSCQ